MCLIIQRPANKPLDFEDFKVALLNNPDGFGLSASDGCGRLETIRDHTQQDPDYLYKLVQEEFLDADILLHLRFTTAGDTTLRNAHPFPILEYSKDGVDLRMAHNGTLPLYKGNTTESDTRRFVKGFVRPLFKRLIKGFDIEEILKDSFVEKLIDTNLTTQSVVSFIDGFGGVLNVNKTGNGGFFDDHGVYFSNKYSFDEDHRKPVTNYYQAGYPTGSSNYKGGSVVPYVHKKENHALDTKTELFTKKYDLTDLSDLISFDDETLLELVETEPEDTVLLIKELLLILNEEILTHE